MSEEVQFGDGEDTLAEVESQSVGGEDGEEGAEVLPVLVLGLAVHAVII